jgi:hypothetical protein
MPRKPKKIGDQNDGLANYRLSPQRRAVEITYRRDSRVFFTLTEILDLGIADDDKRGYLKIGWGEFAPAGDARATDFIRYVFLNGIMMMEREEWDVDAASDMLPEQNRLMVLRELAGWPLEEFEKAGVSDEQVLRLCKQPGRRDLPALRSLQTAVRNWARRWHLDAPWCLSVVYSTLRLWRDFPRARELYVWDNNFPLDRATVELPEEVVDTAPLEDLPPFFAHFELRSKYVRRVRRRLEHHLRTHPFTAKLKAKTRLSAVEENMRIVGDYCDRVMEFYRGQRDAEGAPVWAEVEGRAELERNVRWAIDFQVRGKTYRRIASDETIYVPRRDDQELSHGTVIKAVDDVLRLIGLRKRPNASPGRPRKRKSPST